MFYQDCSLPWIARQDEPKRRSDCLRTKHANYWRQDRKQYLEHGTAAAIAFRVQLIDQDFERQVLVFISVDRRLLDAA